MKTRYLALYLMLWSVISCVSHASKQSALKEYDIDIQQRDAISDFVDSYKTLPLETTKDNLIGNINKVQIIDTCIYVLDKEQATIFVFNTEGKYLNKICRQGRAPEEYLGLSDFMVYNADVYCEEYYTDGTVAGDWWLPKRIEMLRMGNEKINGTANNKFTTLNNKLKTVTKSTGGKATALSATNYISRSAYAYSFNPSTGAITAGSTSINNQNNANKYRVRCITAF